MGPSPTSTETCEVTRESYPKPYYYRKDEDEMSKGQLEVSLSEPYLGGDISAEVYEVESARPTSIIRTDQEWGVNVRWTLGGSLAEFICGTWCVRLRLESMGPGPEIVFDTSEDIHLDPCGNGEYHYDFRIRPGRITGEHCSTPYKPVVTVSYRTACHRPAPMVGFVELPLLLFYPANGTIQYGHKGRHQAIAEP